MTLTEVTTLMKCKGLFEHGSGPVKKEFMEMEMWRGKSFKFASEMMPYGRC